MINEMISAIPEGYAAVVLHTLPCEVDGCDQSTPKLDPQEDLSVWIRKNGAWHHWCEQHILENVPEYHKYQK